MSIGEYDLTQAFGIIDLRLAELPPAQRGSLQSLRRRLVGELVFNADEVAATLAPDFELVTRTGTTATVTSGEAMVNGIRARGEVGGALMWVELDNLLVDAAIAGHGVLRMASTGSSVTTPEGLGPRDLRVTTFEFAMFLNFRGDLMTSEALYMADAAADVATLRDVNVPSSADLFELVTAEVVR